MPHDEKLLNIMLKTIESLHSNKETVICIIKDLEQEYERKKNELLEIKIILPKLMDENSQLRKLDKVLRQDLVNASRDFSDLGHEKMRLLFEETTAAHTQLLKSEEQELQYIKRRDVLELELRKSKINIEKAELMANQLIASLAYLNTGIHNLEEKKQQTIISDESTSCDLSSLQWIESEKSRIARDLHDGPMQRIASVQMRIDFCKTAIGIDLTKGLDLLENLKRDLASTLVEVRDILFDLNPAPIEKIGFKASIEHLLYNILDKQEIGIDFSYTLGDLSLSVTTQNALYRIIQELLNNIKKHSKATKIKLRLFVRNQFLYITIEDNGVGFSVPNDFELLKTTQKSYGLYNIHTRIRQLKGKLKVASTLNKGTTFLLELPT